ncbi:hypothetical protein FNV43_RR26850 [Rhamnella rubrinervis]|uniref:RING-type E3 ubiquitin transferase n=1 Tax=Rhamnella rubrinervis TaxID=2594499 RepID=A0A8K0DKI4_9ROSA|nr:hypothetical protein FNV43_RR26850 [Rhamnella rubrinervis]
MSSVDDLQAPMLRPRQGSSDSVETPSPARPTSLAMLLGRATGRRGPSMLVRETAARELEERRADWGYSKPVVVLDMMWNLAFVVVSVAMLIITIHEHPSTPIRLWICGYALQCFVHVVLVCLEYRRRNARRARNQGASEFTDGFNDTEDDEEESLRASGNLARSTYDFYVPSRGFWRLIIMELVLAELLIAL